MEKEKINLTNKQWQDLVYEDCYAEENNNIIEFEEVQCNYDGSRRHTEDHHKILKRKSDGLFFRIDYETSVKDEMGWSECNYGNTTAIQVFPETVTITEFK
ncbi:MAG: hypothetical protein EOL97_08975 [Spirochaetia bacterium]|nr:hypothetical protein [Spirochaetia bacterium]